MSNLIKTNTKNLYFYNNTKGLKIYVAIIYKNNKRYKKTLGALKIIQAKKQLKIYKFDIECQINDLTFEEVFNEFIDLSLKLNSIKEINTKKSYFKNHMQKLHNMNIDHIKYSDCQNIINLVLEKGLKPKTAKNIKAIMSVVFNFAIKQGYTDNNPATIIDIPKFDNTQYLKISFLQAKTLLENIRNCKNITVRDITLLGFSGRRLGECLNLQWNQVNLDDKYYTIPYQKNKAKRNMQFAMTDEIYSMFLNRYKIALDNNMYSSFDYVFFNPQTFTKYSDISKTFKKIKLASGINVSDFRFHDFRHLLGTFSINKLNIPIELVSHTLGHTSIAVTQRYITKNRDSSKTVGDDYNKMFD